MTHKQQKMAKSTKVSNELEDSLTPKDEATILPAPADVKERKIKVQFDITYKGSDGKVMDGESETMPDMHLTVRQLLENHSRGMDSKVNIRQPLYFDMEIPTINDITDVDAYKAALEKKLAAVNEFVEQELAEQEKTPENEENSPQNTSSEVESE